MLDAQDTQFRLAEDGVVSFQSQASNPLPGEPIARLVKGKSVLQPDFEVTDAKGNDDEAVKARLETWRDQHFKTVLEPLMALSSPGDVKQPVQDIAARVYENMGIVPRESLEDVIGLLDEDDRRALRAMKIRLGPILVFIPALNKPAAVRLRALLWSVYNGGSLPATVPNDGIVSCAVDKNSIDPAFYQSIGYPVFGERAIRIDMLDRVICAVYDGAEKGKFQAKHEMAEWLGASIEGLYNVLEAMGHVKVFDPAEQQQDGVSEESANEADASNDANEAKEKPEQQPEKKPELATFRLKRGKAFEQKAAKPNAKKFDKKDSAKPEKKKGKRNKQTHKEPRVMSAKAKENPEDSPFAVLQQLKTKSDG